jgi:hypothetical protein
MAKKHLTEKAAQGDCANKTTFVGSIWMSAAPGVRRCRNHPDDRRVGMLAKPCSLKSACHAQKDGREQKPDRVIADRSFAMYDGDNFDRAPHPAIVLT